MTSCIATMSAMLVGREAEIRALTALLDGAAAHRGGAVVVRGEAGIGKSALVEHLAAVAAERGMRVAGTSGVLAEVHVAYAGLHRLTRVLGGDLRVGDLDSPFRAAVDLLDLLGAQTVPVLVTVEDAQWLDPPSWKALTFAARRIDVDDVAMVLTVRDGEDLDRQLAEAGLPEQRLEPLSAADAGTLLDRVAPGLSPALRERVLDEAAGNPLGLVELGGIAVRSGAGALLPSWLPLSTRVERTFGALVAELPTPTRALLLVAALDDGDGLDEILAAATIPAWTLVAKDDRVIPAATQRFMAQRAGARVVEVRASHVAMTSRPDATVDLIVAAAKGA